MHRLVLDTNVLVSALLTPKGPPGEIFEGVLNRRWELAVSSEILDEYETVLARKRFGLSEASVKDAMTRLKAVAIFCFPIEVIRACVDPDDNKFLAASVAARATRLITGNRKHFPGTSFMGAAIVSPREFIQSTF